MSVKYTEEQMDKIEKMVGFVEIFADQILTIMKNHELDKVEGCRLMMIVDPSLEFTTREIRFGDLVESDSGLVHLAKGKNEREYLPFMTNSPEYEDIFSPFKKVAPKAAEKPLPVDGLWV